MEQKIKCVQNCSACEEMKKSKLSYEETHSVQRPKCDDLSDGDLWTEEDELLSPRDNDGNIICHWDEEVLQ